MVALSALAGAVIPACTPRINVNLGLGPGEGPLVQQTVIEDKGRVEGTVAMIDVRGLIADARVPDFLLGPGSNPVDNLVARLKLAEDDPAVKAVILRINSPGGTVTGSDTMYREVRRFSERTGKPVVASLGEVAASGGYYLACAADTIIAQPTSITASIGVIIPTYNFSEGLNRIGIRARNVTSGVNKDLADPFSPVRDPQYAVLQGIVDEFYRQFKGLVVSRRPALKSELVPELTDGRIVTGARAVEVGLADRLGGMREAFEEAKGRAGLKGARLIKFVDEFYVPRSPYAALDAPRPSSGGGTEINLLQIKADGMVGASSGVSGIYYLWIPAGN